MPDLSLETAADLDLADLDSITGAGRRFPRPLGRAPEGRPEGRMEGRMDAGVPRKKKRAIPKGTVEIRVKDRMDPEREHLVAARNGRHVYFYRRQDNWHYAVPIEELLGTEFAEVWRGIEQESRVRGAHPVDVLRDLLQRQRESADGLRGWAIVKLAEGLAARTGKPVDAVLERVERDLQRETAGAAPAAA